MAKYPETGSFDRCYEGLSIPRSERLEGVGVSSIVSATEEGYLRIIPGNLFKLFVPRGWVALTEPPPIGNNCLYFR